ncbi:MAG: hypothetical protein WC449_05590 [Candidatus Paceibacterota bacterium]
MAIQIPHNPLIQSVPMAEYANQFAQLRGNQQQNTLRQMQIEQAPQQLARQQKLDDKSALLNQAKINSANTEDGTKKHAALSKLANDLINKMQAQGITDPQQQEDYSRKYQQAMRPYIQNVLGLPGAGDMSLEQVKMIAGSAGTTGESQDWLVVNDGERGAFMMNKKDGSIKPMEHGGQQLRGAPYDANLQGSIEAAKQGQKGVKVTDSQGREYWDTQQNASGGTIGGNYNPGNIRPVGQSQGFQQFASPQEGIQAIDQNLQAYGSQHGINTLSGVISRWSPPNENDTGGLIAAASKRLGISPGQEIDLSDPVQRHAVASVIMLQENPVFGKKQGPVMAPSNADKQALENQAKLNLKQGEADIENQKKLDQDKNQKTVDANETLALLNEIEPLLNETTASGIGADYDKVSAYFGNSTSGADAAASLKALGGRLTSKMPKMSGPQSDKDAALYAEMAGRLGDPTVPVSQRKAVLQTMKAITSNYLGNKSSGPKAGDVEDGYRFKGGDKADPKNWEKI